MKENTSNQHCSTVIGFSLFAVLNIAAFVMTFAVMPLIVSVLSVAVVITELCTKRFPLYAGIAVLAVSVFLLNIPADVFQGDIWRYPFQRTYLQFVCRDNMEYFPSDIPDNVEDYSFYYSSMFSADVPVCMLRYTSDSDEAARIAEIAKENEILTTTLRDHISESDNYMRKIELLTGFDGHVLPIEIPEDIIQQDTDKWMLYVQYSTFDDFNPRTGAVLVNVESGEVCCIKQG